MIWLAFITWWVSTGGLPNGYEKVIWGMTPEELQNITSVEKAESGGNFDYAEHLEDDPDVYIEMTQQRERIEYYFFEGRLYKIFIIYDRMLYNTLFYDRLIGQVKKNFGSPSKTYEEEFLGLLVRHTFWEDEVSTLDLRKGAGFVYQVRTQKAMAERKALVQKRKKAI